MWVNIEQFKTFYLYELKHAQKPRQKLNIYFNNSQA